MVEWDRVSVKTSSIDPAETHGNVLRALLLLKRKSCSISVQFVPVVMGISQVPEIWIDEFNYT